MMAPPVKESKEAEKKPAAERKSPTERKNGGPHKDKPHRGNGKKGPQEH